MSANENGTYDPTAPVLTVRDLMARWKCTRKSVLEAIHAHGLAAFRIGKRAFRVTLAEVMRYEQTRSAA